VEFEDGDPFDAEDGFEVPVSLLPPAPSENSVLALEDPEPGVTLAQNEEMPAAPAAFCKFLKATLLLFGCPLLAM